MSKMTIGSMFKQMTDGLFDLHENNIFHNDIKMDNYFAHGGIYKLGDFNTILTEELNMH